MQIQSKINAGVLAPVKIAATCVAALFMASPVWALNSRSWVSSHGSDVNNCTVYYPCLSFQHAYYATALGGEVDAMDPGDYGTLLIGQSITIDGGNMGYIRVPGNGTGIQVNAIPGSVVILRNLSIANLDGPPYNSADFGVLWSTGWSLSIEGVSFNGMLSALQSENAEATHLLVKDVTIENCGSGIVSTSPSMFAVVDHVTMQYVGYGVELILGKATITHSVISYALNAGIQAGFGTSEAGPLINVEDSSILYSAVGLNVTRGTVRIAGDSIHDNTVGLQVAANLGQIVSFGDNRILGNGSGETPSSTVALK